jgi:hypothetical protein
LPSAPVLGCPNAASSSSSLGACADPGKRHQGYHLFYPFLNNIMSYVCNPCTVNVPLSDTWQTSIVYIYNIYIYYSYIHIIYI